MRVVRFKRTIGEIPTGSIGFFTVNPITGAENENRVVVLRRFVGLDESIIPMYDWSPQSNAYDELDESTLSADVKEELSALAAQVKSNTKVVVLSRKT